MSDLISRQAAIDAMKNRWKKTRNYEGIGDDIAEECELYLKQVPPAQPERPKGHWIYVGDGYTDYFKCSECGELSDYEGNFCCDCGSDNRGGQDAEAQN